MKDSGDPRRRDRGAARAHLHPERGHPAHHLDARPRHRARRGGRERPRPDRRQPRRRRHRRRRGGARGLRPLRPHPGAEAAARPRPPVRAPARNCPDPCGSPTCRATTARSASSPRERPTGPCWARRCATAAPTSAASSSPGKRATAEFTDEDEEVLVLVRGPGPPRSSTPARTAASAGAGRPRGPGRDLPGGRRARRPRRPSGVPQPRGAANRREPADARPSDRAAPGGNHLPPRRRARGVAERVSRWLSCSPRARRCAPRRSCSRSPTGAASGRCSTSRRSAPRGGAVRLWW